jgi:hypothetical protein
MTRSSIRLYTTCMRRVAVSFVKRHRALVPVSVGLKLVFANTSTRYLLQQLKLIDNCAARFSSWGAAGDGTAKQSLQAGDKFRSARRPACALRVVQRVNAVF